MTRLFSLILISLLLGACLGSTPPLQRDHYYRIVVPAEGTKAADPSLPGVVSVPPFEADGLLRERPLLFSTGGRSHELQQYVYHYWSDAPPRMLQAALAVYLRRNGLARSVVTPSLRVRPDFEVVGRIKRLEQLLGDGGPRVAVELELALLGLGQDDLLVLETYTAERSVRDNSVEASVVSLNEAVTEIFGRFVADARRTEVALGRAREGDAPEAP
jgi:ABC-type uncharacterized transport system auxiliary subunit